MTSPNPLNPSSPDSRFNPAAHLPENMLLGSAKDYLQSLEPVTRKVVGTTLLRLIAGQRIAHVTNGEALKVLAELEHEVMVVMSGFAPGPREVWVNEIPGK